MGQDGARLVSRPARREFTYDRANVRGGRILEIGALDSPTFPERNINYLDWFSRDELMAELAENPRHTADRIVDPEYVVKDKRFAEHIDARFDVVIANHVIEHVADPITWLQQIRVVAPHGDLFLAVPDRRHTFDYLRPDSTIAPMLRAHSEDLQQPSRWQLLDTLFYYRPFRAENAWAGDFAPLEKRRFTVTEALNGRCRPTTSTSTPTATCSRRRRSAD